MMDFAKMNVEDLRAVLVGAGYSQEKANGIKGKTALVEEVNKLPSFEKKEPLIQKELFEELNQEPDDNKVEIEAPETPSRTSPLWHDYVMKQFTEDELVEDPTTKNKLPNVDGLRRVTEVLIGNIESSVGTVIKAPTSEDRSATVEYRIRVSDVSFGGIADANVLNVEGEYQKHLSSIAETRAEARALRKVLGLKKIVAAEEVTSPSEGFKPEEFISDVQILLIDKLCKKNNIDVIKFANSGKRKFDKIEEVPKEVANNMCAYLNEYARGAVAIPENIKGYNNQWR